MTPDFHPEDLIDRARDRGLGPDEQATLERHLASCPACAAHVLLAPRFEREIAPQPRDPLIYERGVEAALLRIQQSSPVGRRRAAPPWVRWAAAAVLLACGVTGAAAVIARRIAQRPAIQSPVPAVEPTAARAPIRPVEAAPAEAPMPESPHGKMAPSAHGSARPAVTAAAMFERGEKLRREQRMDAAIATYRRLQATFPETAEARLSFALAGQLLLEQGRADDALTQFDRHLKMGGEVGEEALAGRATALEQLHRTADAVAAWKSLLARHPGSVYAERARVRLDKLLIERQ